MSYDGTQLNETAAHLLRAKRYIEEHGWLQGRAGDDGGPRCGYGALDSTGTTLNATRSVTLLRKVVGGSTFPYWQDAPERTVEEVYAAFDRAIALAMESGDA